MFTTVDQVKTIIANFLNKTGRGGFITGTVSSVSPLKIRINARLEITEENLYVSDNCIGLSLNSETLIRSPLAVGDGVILITRPSTIDGTKYILLDRIQSFSFNKNKQLNNISGDLDIDGNASINGNLNIGNSLVVNNINYSDLALKPVQIWSGSVQGGTTINLDVSTYNMIKVDTYPWGVYTPVYIDLINPLGFVAANGYGGGTFSPEINSVGEIERLYAWVAVNTAKNQILPALGFEKGTTKNARNGYSTYLIKKIWGVK